MKTVYELALAALEHIAQLARTENGNDAGDSERNGQEGEGEVASSSNAAEQENDGESVVGHGLGGLCVCECLGKRLDLVGPGFGDVAKPELLDGGARHAGRICERKNLLAGKLLQLGAERLYGSDWLIHPRILIHIRIERHAF